MTNQKNNPLDKLLKESLSDKSSVVPEFVWDNIEKEITKKKKRRGFIWWFWLGIIVGALGIIGFLINQSFKKNTTKQFITHKKEIINNTQNQIDSSTTVNSTTNEITIKKSDIITDSITTTNTLITKEAAIIKSGKVRNSLAQIKKKNNNKELKTEVEPTQTNNSKTKITESNEVNKTNTENAVAYNLNYIQPITIGLINDKLSLQEAKLTAIDTNNYTTVKKDSINKNYRFSFITQAGLSLYDMAIYKDYFTSGALSNRSFKSSGYELAAGLNYNITQKLGIYSILGFNKKQTQFNYNVVIDEPTFLNYYQKGELIPIENLDNNTYCDCFIAKNVSASYSVRNWLFSLGGMYKLFQYKKISINVDLRVSTNIQSQLKIVDYTVLKGFEKNTTKFSSLKPGVGIVMQYALKPNILVGIAPIYTIQFYVNNKSVYAKPIKELILPVSFSYKF